jgi:hypothetical protein
MGNLELSLVSLCSWLENPAVQELRGNSDRFDDVGLCDASRIQDGRDEDSVEDIWKTFVWDLRWEMAPRLSKNPWGPLKRCDEQLFRVDCWIDKEEEGCCWLRDLELTKLNLDRWLETVREDH